VSETTTALLYPIDAAVARVTIDRPAVHRVLSRAVMQGLKGFERAARDPVRKGR
jgi:hypothetical protein